MKGNTFDAFNESHVDHTEANLSTHLSCQPTPSKNLTAATASAGNARKFAAGPSIDGQRCHLASALETPDQRTQLPEQEQPHTCVS